MRMKADQMAQFKIFAPHVRLGMPKILTHHKIVQAIKHHSGASDEIIKKGLWWGSGPFLDIKQMFLKQLPGDAGWIDPSGGYTLGTNIIDLSASAVAAFEAGHDQVRTKVGEVSYMTVVLLHELTHWAREQSGTKDDPDVEDGWEFEIEAYGRKIVRE
jgi:Metallopeptidase toxin 3